MRSSDTKDQCPKNEGRHEGRNAEGAGVRWTLISFFNPAGNKEGMTAATKAGTNVIAMDMVPRISRAQKMDALSSMANIAGYRAVIEAGNNFGRFFTGQVTAAGKVPPAKVLVVGAGVAGLAAIGTATSLGAITYAFDVRPEVAEQIESMGAEFVFSNSRKSSRTARPPAAMPRSVPEFREKQLEKFRELAPDMDIVITTALIPNRPAPKLWTKDMVEDEARLGHRRPRGRTRRQLQPDRGREDRHRQRRDHHRLHRFPQPHGHAILHALRHQHPPHDDRPDAREGRQVNHNMEDDVIRGATVTFDGEITFPPPPPKVAAIAARRRRKRPRS
jgi:NAD(P) transhydrogenase subunit alpha